MSNVSSADLDAVEPSRPAEPEAADSHSIVTSTTLPNSNDLPTPTNDSRLSIFDIPIELRMEIWALLLESNSIPRSYGYTASLSLSKVKPSMLKHGMIIVNKQLSLEYRQTFYERTTFFFRINGNNAFKGVPDLSYARQDAPSRTQAGVPNFWNAPDALLANLRHCTIYTELGSIASNATARHSVSRVVLANTSRMSATKVRMEMMEYSSLEELKAQDSIFDGLLRTSIEEVLDYMQQLRSVRVVWDTAVETRGAGSRFSTNASTNWTWETFGTPIVESLKKKPNMRSFQVNVGDRYQDVTYKAERGDRGRWNAEQHEYKLRSPNY